MRVCVCAAVLCYLIWPLKGLPHIPNLQVAKLHQLTEDRVGEIGPFELRTPKSSISDMNRRSSKLKSVN